MPSLEHEFPLSLVRQVPDLAAWLFGRAAGAVPEFERARREASEATTTAPSELLADSVTVLERDDDDGNPVSVQAIVIECQNGYDPDKQFTWPMYVTNIRARLRCPVVLLVVTPTESLANWCAQPIDAGCGYLIHQPLTMSWDSLPPVTTEAEAQAHPELTVFSAFARCRRNPSALKLVPAAINVLSKEKGPLYADHVMASLNGVARKQLEEEMTMVEGKYETEFFGRPYRQGKATALLDILETRGIHVDEDAHARIMDCTDEEQLDAWVRRAVTVSSASELFA